MFFLLLFAVVAASYWFYSSLPSTQYSKALNAYNNNDNALALTLFDAIKDKHEEANVRIAEIKYEIAANYIKTNEQQKAIFLLHETENICKNSEKTTLNKTDFANILVKINLAILEVYHQYGIDLLQQNETADAVVSFKKALTYASADANIKSEICNTLAEIEYKNGVANEQQNRVNEAIAAYEKAADYFINIEKNKLFFEIQSRQEICNLKINKMPNERIIKELGGKNPKSKLDLMYRYALYLAKKGDTKQCTLVLETQLNAVKSSEIEKLKTYCQQYYSSKATSEIAGINAVIAAPNKENMEALYDKIDEIIFIFERGFPELATNVKNIKSYLFSNLTSQYFEVEAFEKVLAHITSFPDFYKQTELLQNTAIACLRLTTDGKLNRQNYQNIISIWLTAVHHNQIIIQSLEHTEWDDPYNFTLIDALGSKIGYADVVENINFDAPTDENISIGATQRELVAVFENVINAIEEPKFAQEVQAFYTQEKQAIEQIIKYGEDKMLYMSPYFGKKYSDTSTILSYLSFAYNRQADLEILKIGSQYVVGNKQPQIFHDYQAAQTHIQNCVKAIADNNLSNLSLENTTTNKVAIRQLEPLKNELEKSLLAAFNARIKKDDEDQTLIPLFEIAIEISENNKQLRRKASDFIAEICKTWLSEDKNEINALELIIKALKIEPESQTCANLAGVLANNNLMNIINDETREENRIYTLCRSLKNIPSTALKTKLKDLAAQRTKLLTHLGTGVAAQLESGYNLNAQGEKLKRALDCMYDVSGVGTGKPLVDKLLQDMLRNRNL